MKAKKLAALLAAALMLALLSACSGGSTTIPFASVTLSAAKKDVVAAYGESSDTETATDGGETLNYKGEYQGKDGRLGFHFTQDGKIKTIFWSYNPEDRAEYDELLDAIKGDMAKDFGQPIVEEENRLEWKNSKTDINVFTLAIDGFGGHYSVNIVGSENNGEGGDAASAEVGVPVGIAEYKVGDVAQGETYTLTVDSVDATPEYGDYIASEKDQMFFLTSLELTNNGEAPVDVGDVLKFFADDEECKWTRLFENYNGVDQLDTYTSVEAGKKVKGYIAVVVPDKWNKVQLLCEDVAFTFTHADLGSISSQNTAGETPTYTMGETLTRNGMKVTLTGAMQTDYIADGTYFYYEPDDGKHFVVMFFDIRNDSDQSQKFKVTAVFDPYVDDYSSRFTSFLSTKINNMEGLTYNDYTDILPGKSLQGYAVIEAPDGWTKIELTTRQGNFELTSDQVAIQ